MNGLLLLVPLALVIGLVGLAALLWAIKSGQYSDMEGDAHRILLDDDAPLTPDPQPGDKT